MKNTVTLLEYINDNGEWSWYGIFSNATPKEACTYYLEENNIEGEKIRSDGEYEAIVDDTCRAEIVELIQINK